MPRPRKCRMVDAKPGVWLFKPQGIPARLLDEVYLPIEGYEALRLADLEGLRQDEAAAKMKVSRQTFGRILADARRAVADALIHGLALRIEGGAYRMQGDNLEKTMGEDAGACIVQPAAHTSQRKSNMRKIAVSSEGPALDSPVDPRFGRAAGFVIIDPESMAFEYVDNGASQAMNQGAGIQAAELMTQHDVGVVLTGYVGPKAFHSLAAVGIKIGQNLEGLSVRAAVEKYKSGQVSIAEAPNRTGGRP
ncbi:MAG: DUF134 domain-containing protein [Deltaproteobacteria bacterium]|nr:DUF134 domain-containing protein [Deltaproteobacteria bacterium]